MRSRWKVWFAAVALACQAGLAQAAEPAIDLLDPPVSYTADFTFTSDKGTFRGKIWHAPGKERREYSGGAGEQVLLVRRDRGAVYLLKPQTRWYVGLGLDAALALAGGGESVTVDRQPLREERLGAVKATRYRVSARGAEGRDFVGDAWFTAKGVLVKAVGATTGSSGRKHRVEMVLSRLRLQTVPPETFEIPRGWFGVDLHEMPAESLKGAMKGLKLRL